MDLPPDDDPFREDRAFNYSIYLMVGMPYLLLGAVGFFVYRGLRRRAELEGRAADRAPAREEGNPSWPDTSRGEVS